MIRVVVDNRIRIPLADLDPHPNVREALERAFTHRRPDHAKDPERIPEFERTWGEVDGHLTLPRGGMPRARASMRGIPYRVEDRRANGLAMQVPHSRTLWAHQERIVGAVGTRQNCLIRASTGSGKTSAALAAACRFGRWAIAIVWTKGLMDQWVDRIVEECGLDRRDVGIVQGTTRRLAPLTVAMQQTLASNPLGDDELAKFGFVVVDEVQRSSAETVYEVADRFPAKYRVGVSASEKRQDRREYLIHDLFGEVAEEFTAGQAVEAGVTVDVEVVAVETGWDPGDWYRQATMSGNRFRARAAHQKMQSMLANNIARAAQAADIAASEHQQGRTVAVLTERRAHCDLLASELVRRGVRPGMMIGGPENAREFDETRRKVRDGSLRAIVGTVRAIGTGIDVPAFDRGVVCCHLTNNEQLFGQVRGRFCRTAAGKDGAKLYVLVDPLQGRRAIDNLRKWNRSVEVRERPGAPSRAGAVRFSRKEPAA